MDEGLAKIRHARSKKDFPFLKLEDDEFVEYAFMRAKTWLLMSLGAIGVGVAVVLLAFLLVLLSADSLDEMGHNFLYVLLFVMVAAALVVVYMTLKIYRGNWLFVTNKHVIQMVMTSPLAGSTNIIDLSSVEDVSFAQNGILPRLFNYGTLRLSTVGDETTYTFSYASVSPNDLRAVSKLLTAAKKVKKTEEKSE